MSNKSFTFVLFLSIYAFFSISAKPLDSGKIVVALNCGSKTQQVSSSQGHFKYVPDQKFVQGSSVDVDYHNDAPAVDAQIKYTFQKQVYMFERHTYKEMVYSLPVKRGKHTIILKFAEMYFKNKGQRVFNIKIGDVVVRENFDVLANSGAKYAAHEQYIEVNVKTDGVYFQGQRVNKGMENNKLKLSFVKGKADNPIVQGIIVYNDAIENSPEQDFIQMKTKWGSQQQMLKAKREEKYLKQLIQIQKKNQKLSIRNDQLISDQEQDKVQSPSSQSTDKYGTLRNLLMGPIGIIIWSIIFGYAALFIYKNIFAMDASNQIVGKSD